MAGEVALHDMLYATNHAPATADDEDPYYSGERGYLMRAGSGQSAFGNRLELAGPALTDGAADCHLQAAVVNIATAGKVQCSAVVYRGADDG